MKDYLSAAKHAHTSINIEGLEFNPETRTLSHNGQVIDLEPRSVELLELFLTSVGEPLSADTIIESVWQSNFISKNVLTNRISTLRSIIQKSLPDSDATKILVTYPRKGYYFNASSVSLDNHQESPSPESAPVPSTPSKANLVLCALLAISLTCTAIVSYLYWTSSSNTASLMDEQRLIPKVELLLNRVDAIGENARKHRSIVKAVLLQQQIEYAFTDIANQDAPSYFLDPIDSSPFFPGAKNMRTSDYLVNIQLKDREVDSRLSAKISLLYPSSGKLAFRGIYSIDVSDIADSLMAINKDLAHYFTLPEPSETAWSANTSKVMPLLAQQSLDIDSIPLDEMTATLLARHLVLFETDKQKLIQFTNRIQAHFSRTPDELTLWLGMISFKVRDLTSAREFLTTPAGNSRIENALVYMVISHIAYKQGNMDKFRLNYMESLVALLRVVPSEALFDRLSQPESEATCLQPWQSLKLSVKDPIILKQWENLMLDYCHSVGLQISKPSSSTF
ncbi:transcriptional regulator [Vibrio sp. T187]|uniref:winged helix-turn-helix domain-containing protein n=1 Tax=Vibrio TaxID=662 RepID=UPI0010CA1EE0|nr:MULTISPECIES: winged helix-turn-helix domain-containing protein [Vibrio]MBW3694328.1 transcriptional regulator [Vibrio sp. T187]